MKSINIKGKQYVMVHERIKEFWSLHPDWSINTEIITVGKELVKGQEKEFVVMKCNLIDEKNIVRSTGYARETQGSSFINSTSHIENCECVPLNVRILTLDGWKNYLQLKEGDKILNCNVEKGVIEIDQILKINHFEKAPIVEIGNTRFKAKCTKNHKWIVGNELIELKNIKKYQKIKLGAIYENKRENENIINAKKLGWIFSDCTLKYSNGIPSSAIITQSKKENFEILNQLFGKSKEKKTKIRFWNNGKISIPKKHYYWKISSKELRELLLYFGVFDSKDLVKAVINMTKNERLAYYESMMLADGSNRSFSKTDKYIVEAMQVCIFLNGSLTSKIKPRKNNYMTKKDCYTISLQKTTEKYFSEFKTKILPSQPVWCPTTNNGTWIADFDGYIALTGNTSCIGRALGLLGIGIDTSIASAEEVQNAILQQKQQKQIPQDMQNQYDNMKKRIKDNGDIPF